MSKLVVCFRGTSCDKHWIDNLNYTQRELDFSDLSELDLVDGLDTDMDNDMQEVPFVSKYQHQQGEEIPLNKFVNIPQNGHKNTDIYSDIKTELISDINGTTKSEKSNDFKKYLTNFDTIPDPSNNLNIGEQKNDSIELQKLTGSYQDHINKPQNDHKEAINRKNNHVDIQLENNINIPQVKEEDKSPN